MEINISITSNSFEKFCHSDYHISMKYVVYQASKYILITIILIAVIMYLAKTDRLPMFLPDSVRNTLIDLSDYLLSHQTLRAVYSPFHSALDFIADDGYSYKYSVLPKTIVDRLRSEFSSIENSINLFLNNPLFETWIIPNTFPTEILEETFKNYFYEDFYSGFSIYSSKFIEIFSLGISTSNEDFRKFLLSTDTVKHYKDYILKVRKLSKYLDFIDGFLVVYIDKNKFFEHILASSKDDFALFYVSLNNDILYSSTSVPKEYLLENMGSEYISLFGKTLRQKVLKYESLDIGFVIPEPSWTRWIYVSLKVSILIGIIAVLFYVNRNIVLRLKKSSELKKKMIDEIKKIIKDQPLKRSDMAISNLLVKTTEENLKFFESLVENDVKTFKELKKKVSFFR